MSLLDLGLWPPVALYKVFSSFLFSCKSLHLSQTGILFSVTGRVKLALRVSRKPKETHYAVVSIIHIMFKVAFEEWNELKYPRIIQVFNDAFHMMLGSTSLQILCREVQCVFLTPGMLQSKGNGFPHTLLILHYLFPSYSILWSSPSYW